MTNYTRSKHKYIIANNKNTDKASANNGHSFADQVAISYNKINSIIKNLDEYYAQASNNHTGGGNKYDTSMSSKLKKYKKFIKNSKESIMYFKNVAEQYYSAYYNMNAYYADVLEQLKIKKNELEAVSNKMQHINQSNSHNLEKISMLESMMTVLEKLTKNQINVDMDLKSTLNGQELKYNTNAKFNNQEKSNTKTFPLTGGVNNQSGGLNLEEFSNAINHDIGELDTFVIGLGRDNEFINTKITALRNRMDTIVNNTERFFNIRAKVEWIVNQLELVPEPDDVDAIMEGAHDAPPAEQDYQDLYNNIKARIDEIKTKPSIDPNISQYIIDLEKYAAYLENFIASSERTLDGLSAPNRAVADAYATTLRGQAGGGLQEDYNCKANKMVTDLVELFQIPFNHVTVNQNVSELLVIDDADFDHVSYGKYVTIYRMLKKLDEVLKEYHEFAGLYEDERNIIATLIQDNPDVDGPWTYTFKDFNTTFYADMMGVDVYDNDVDALKQIGAMLASEPDNGVVNIDINLGVDLDVVIRNLDSTILYYKHVTFMFASITLVSYVFNGMDGQIDILISIITEMERLRGKSYILDTPDNFNPVYQRGGKYDVITIKELPKIDMAGGDLDSFRVFCKEFLEQLGKKIKSMKDSSKKINVQEIVDNIVKKQTAIIQGLTARMSDLYYKVALKLGDSKELTVSEAESSSSFVELLESLPKVNQKGGAIVRPRLTQFKLQLVSCKEQLGPLLQQSKKLKKACKGIVIPVTNNKEMKASIQIATRLSQSIKQGTNSYIKVLPLVFFTIEFPPALYEKAPCKYTFSYDTIKETVSYNPPSTGAKCAPDERPEGTAVVTFKTHAAFLKSNNKNGTKYLLDDPVIGLKKLIESEGTANGPENKVLNMMFAMGASGTGKTTRYFGAPTGSEDDKEGIVTSVIKNASNTATIELAYFVCYGQKTANSFEELLIFFNIDPIMSQSEDADNTKYTPYRMPSSESVEPTGYTSFYTALVTRKLQKVDYTAVKDFVENGGPLTEMSVNIVEQETFREVLESAENSVWKTISEGDKLDDIFEQLLTEQKKIHTVLPTKNNIESSRGHTCVLIKITDGGKVKYFPLFDMAGTEDTTKMADFFTAGRNVDKMSKFVKIISKETQGESITDNDDHKYNSLDEIISTDPTIACYVQKSQAGGGKNKKIETLYQTITNDTIPTDGEQFLQKIINEGFYINHAIGMFVFAAMCVGKSLQTTKDGDVDSFDTLPDLFEDFGKFASIVGEEDVTKTQVLLTERSYKGILEKSCIWAQVLFSFLYWNGETTESANQIVSEFKESKTVSPGLMCELKDSVYVGDKSVEDVMKIESAIVSAAIENIKEIETLMTGVNTQLSSEPSLQVKTINLKGEKIYIECSEITNKLEPKANNAGAAAAAKSAEIPQNITTAIKTLESYLKADAVIAPDSAIRNIDVLKEYSKLKSLKISRILGQLRTKADRSNLKNVVQKIIELQNKIETSASVPDPLVNIRAQKAIIDTFNELSNPYKYAKLVEILDFFKKDKLTLVLQGDKLQLNGTPVSTILSEIEKLLAVKEKCSTPNVVEINQMGRIQAGRITATKMAVMLLVTGQGSKHNMVLETVRLEETLYESSTIDLTKE
jgi:hypothetical protein